jgi:small subunit ribosomal protein S9
MEKNNVFYATGKRKTAIAKTWLKPGKGSITVNDKPVDEYFTVPSAKRLLIEPMVMTNTLDQYDVVVRVVGGRRHGSGQCHSAWHYQGVDRPGC